MHDIDRGANLTAARLTALAALRNAQADEARDADRTRERSAPDGCSRRAADTEDGSNDRPRDTAGGPASERPAGVYAAVESAVKRSRIEFLSRLLDYRRRLDCEAFATGGPDSFSESFDEAQFVAHRIAGVGKTLGFADLGDQARQAEAAITAYKLESTSDLRQIAIARICNLMRLIENTCAEHEDCQA